MNDLYRKTRFLLSAPELKHAPADSGIEIAFAGRSNAGKSSTINTLTAQNSLARTSKTPGRTRQLVYFEIDEQRRLVDLPGYGYAKVAQSMQQEWRQTMERYFQKRRSLGGIFLIMDIRHPLTPFDQQMIDWCSLSKTSIHLVLTKSDKLNYGAAKNTLLKVRKQLADRGIQASVQLFSSLKKAGIDEAHAVLDAWFLIERDQSS